MINKSDFLASHDFEDIIAVLDGCSEIVDEVINSDKLLRQYLAENFEKMLLQKKFQIALPGHLNYGSVTNERTKIVLDRIKQIVNITS